MQWVLQDLMFLREAGIGIDADLFAQVLESENTHRNFAPCTGCGVRTFGQHLSYCPWASILFEENWFKVVSR